MEAPETQEQLEELVAQFVTVAQQAGLPVRRDQIQADILPAPHRPPTRLPFAKQAIYWFSVSGRCLKAGKVGALSGPRYTSQHYNPKSSSSNLAKSMLKNRTFLKDNLPPILYPTVDELTEATVGAWIKQHAIRCNLVVDLEVGEHVLSFLETFIHANLKPLFEGRA